MFNGALCAHVVTLGALEPLILTRTATPTITTTRTNSSANLTRLPTYYGHDASTLLLVLLVILVLVYISCS